MVQRNSIAHSKSLIPKPPYNNPSDLKNTKNICFAILKLKIADMWKYVFV